MFHKEGFNLIILFFILVAFDVIMLEFLFDDSSPEIYFTDLFSYNFVLILWFFRNPKRNIKKNPELILSPADGTISIKEADELEYFKNKKIQISIFLSPLYMSRYPVSGEILYSKYHKGDYLVAWNPKSSSKNERTTVVIKQKIWRSNVQTDSWSSCKKDCKLCKVVLA